MRTTKLALILAFGLQPSAFSLLSAAPFDCGSNGTNGAINITSNTTLQLPPDGIFHCTTITVAAGATLSFSNNALNTPVYLLATGDVTINGTIDVSAHGQIGGPGGFNGGSGGSVNQALSSGGDGMGPGGGKSIADSYGAIHSLGVFSKPITINTNVYGNLLCSPLIGGSGGGGSDGMPGGLGGGGGGAILIASNTKIMVNGAIQSFGSAAGNWGLMGGSGGTVRLVSPVVSGNGKLNTLSSDGNNYTSWGRIRIDCTDFLAWRSLTMNGLPSRGNHMVVFPAPIPRLDILEVAANAIPEGTNSPAIFELASGTSTNQSVTVQARNFTNDVPIRVVITPANGSSAQYDATILQSSGNPPFVVVPVVFPAGSECQVKVWSR